MRRRTGIEIARFAAGFLLPHRRATHIFIELPEAEKDRRMARVTVEDCVLKVPNRFELVLLAAQRAREITSGAPLTLDRDDDKNPVVALREIADETIALDHLKDSVVRGMQKQIEMDEPEETPELEQTLFGVADPTGSVIGEDEIDEEALDDELEEDMLAGEDVNEPPEEPAADSEIGDEEP